MYKHVLESGVMQSQRKRRVDESKIKNFHACKNAKKDFVNMTECF